MDIEKKLQAKFHQINAVTLEKQGNEYFLQIEVNVTKMTLIIDLSKAISQYLDEINPFDHHYFLDIFSSGTDQVISMDRLERAIGQNVLIKLKINVKAKSSFEGKLISVNEKDVIIKWNAKGQLRQEKISKDNILEVKLYAKVK